MRIVWSIVGIVLFCWATVSAFSIFSELKFLVDGWTWSVGQVPITIKTVALAIGKYVSGIVGGYREFVRALVAMLPVSRLPQVLCDVVGVTAFTISRGMSIALWWRRDEEQHDELVGQLRRQWALEALEHEDPNVVYWARFTLNQKSARLWFDRIDSILMSIVAVNTVIGALFSIDFLYRHFA
jgi:hypothetical protein